MSPSWAAFSLSAAAVTRYYPIELAAGVAELGLEARGGLLAGLFGGEGGLDLELGAGLSAQLVGDAFAVVSVEVDGARALGRELEILGSG